MLLHVCLNLLDSWSVETAPLCRKHLACIWSWWQSVGDLFLPWVGTQWYRPALQLCGLTTRNCHNHCTPCGHTLTVPECARIWVITRQLLLCLDHQYPISQFFRKSLLYSLWGPSNQDILGRHHKCIYLYLSTSARMMLLTLQLMHAP